MCTLGVASTLCMSALENFHRTHTYATHCTSTCIKKVFFMTNFHLISLISYLIFHSHSFPIVSNVSIHLFMYFCQYK